MTCRPGTWSCVESRLTPSPFDTRRATSIGVGPPGFFLGNNQALVHTRDRFLAVFAEPDADGPPRVAARGVAWCRSP